MDYIIFGIGAGATLVLTGWILREWGPRIRDRKPADDEILSASEMVTRMAWARFCATCGMALVLSGLLVIVATLVALLFNPSDERGALVAIVAFGVAVVLMLIWSGLYLRQFGTFGVLRPRVKAVSPPPEEAPEPASTDAESRKEESKSPAAPEPTFADAAASPGGLGRFASFFRRESPPPEKSVASPPPGDIEPILEGVEEPIGGSTVGESTPTEAVIAELAGATEPSPEKRLSPGDPLIPAPEQLTATADNVDIEAVLVADVLGSGKSVGGPGDERTAAMTSDDSAAALPQDEASMDDALDSLRRRRLERLARDSSSS